VVDDEYLKRPLFSKRVIINAVAFIIVTWPFALVGSEFISQMGEQSRATACFSNMRQLGSALAEYEYSSDNRPPPVGTKYSTVTWRTYLYTYDNQRDAYSCPSRYDHMTGADGFANDYSVNESVNALFMPPGIAPISYTQINDPGDLIAICESEGYGPAISIDDPIQDLKGEAIWAGHSHGTHFLMCDGHTTWIGVGQTTSPVNIWYGSAKPLSAAGMWRIRHAVN
jgi:prepilin-type processing-associated H-X9-DG protein